MKKAKMLWYIKEIVADVLFFAIMIALIILLLGVAPM